LEWIVTIHSAWNRVKTNSANTGAFSLRKSVRTDVHKPCCLIVHCVRHMLYNTYIVVLRTVTNFVRNFGMPTIQCADDLSVFPNMYSEE